MTDATQSNLICDECGGPLERYGVHALSACDAGVEVARLRQGLWDVAVLAGVDTDGDTTPDHLTYPDIVTWAMSAVRELREDYDYEVDNAPLP